jgi:hypothetical protein
VLALDEYLSWVGNTYYNATEEGAASGQWALLRRTTLGRLTSPVREPNVFDSWSPLEVAKFEAAICLVGKKFNLISKVRAPRCALARSVRGRRPSTAHRCLLQVIGTKSTSDVIAFYYVWKQSKNYRLWKSSYAQSLEGASFEL